MMYSTAPVVMSAISAALAVGMPGIASRPAVAATVMFDQCFIVLSYQTIDGGPQTSPPSCVVCPLSSDRRVHAHFFELRYGRFARKESDKGPGALGFLGLG